MVIALNWNSMQKLFSVLENEGYLINTMNSDMERLVSILKNKDNLKQISKKKHEIFTTFIQTSSTYISTEEIYIYRTLTISLTISMPNY